MPPCWPRRLSGVRMHVVVLAAASFPIAEPFAGGLESLTLAPRRAACAAAAST